MYKLISDIFTAFSIMMITIFTVSSHPLFMIIILIITAIINSYLVMKIQMLYWVSIMIILGLVGGMMILFLYSTSLVPNEKFIIHMSSLSFVIIILFFTVKPIKIDFIQSMQWISINELYSFQYFIMGFMLVLILVMLNFVMKIIFDPLISLKSSFYEKSN